MVVLVPFSCFHNCTYWPKLNNRINLHKLLTLYHYTDHIEIEVTLMVEAWHPVIKGNKKLVNSHYFLLWKYLMRTHFHDYLSELIYMAQWLSDCYNFVFLLCHEKLLWISRDLMKLLASTDTPSRESCSMSAFPPTIFLSSFTEFLLKKGDTPPLTNM